MSDFNTARRKLLANELDLMKNLAAESSHFEFTAIGDPPTHYKVTFRCRGVVRLDGDEPILSDEHQAEIIVHEDYPFSEDSIEIQWKTPILHPNIDLEHGPCIRGTPLGAGVHFAQICEFLAAMVQYQRYNPRHVWASDTARAAADWALRHADQLPLDRTSLRDRPQESVPG